MSENTVHRTEHKVTVEAPAATVYDLVADVATWPEIFPPTVHVEHVRRGEREEVIQLWATAGEEVKSWTSLRELDPSTLQIAFRQQVSQPPVAAMGGTWLVEPLAHGRCQVRLLHDFRAVQNDAEGVRWITEAVNRNSEKELAALTTAAEQHTGGEELRFSFEDRVRMEGDLAAAYEFIYDGAKWAERLPHVESVTVREDTPNVQTLAMVTRARNNTTHETRSHRICFPGEKIVYKQLVVPALMKAHTGQWTFEKGDDGSAEITSRHTVVLEPVTVEEVLGAGATVADSRTFVQEALSANSRATLRLAASFAGAAAAEAA
ncbi:aromatase/cyclase [Streptomyces sp. 769]|uniref:aromatase/cyclase n=1 Tax=Streptomyces sp. 769 TaxID=1262452 RepID=UPI000581E751|nr:aromatase/cyclase [Streptomyces sp. 769]AJC62148.1 cyclase-like protein [Streptomyces sp. 769]